VGGQAPLTRHAPFTLKTALARETRETRETTRTGASRCARTGLHPDGEAGIIIKLGSISPVSTGQDIDNLA